MKQKILLSAFFVLTVCFSFSKSSLAQTNKIDIEEFVENYSGFSGYLPTITNWKADLIANNIREKFVYEMDLNSKDSFLYEYFKFDKNANVLLNSICKKSGRLSYRTENEYDSIGNKIKTTQCKSNNLIEIIEYENNNGYIQSEKHYNKRYKLKKQFIFESTDSFPTIKHFYHKSKLRYSLYFPPHTSLDTVNIKKVFPNGKSKIVKIIDSDFYQYYRAKMKKIPIDTNLYFYIKENLFIVMDRNDDFSIDVFLYCPESPYKYYHIIKLDSGYYMSEYYLDKEWNTSNYKVEFLVNDDFYPMQFKSDVCGELNYFYYKNKLLKRIDHSSTSYIFKYK